MGEAEFFEWLREQNGNIPSGKFQNWDGMEWLRQNKSGVIQGMHDHLGIRYPIGYENPVYREEIREAKAGFVRQNMYEMGKHLDMILVKAPGDE